MIPVMVCEASLTSLHHRRTVPAAHTAPLACRQESDDEVSKLGTELLQLKRKKLLQIFDED